MPVETITLHLPTSLAQELTTVNQEFLLDILERGLRQFKIERALEKYSQGGFHLGQRHSKHRLRNLNWPGRLMQRGWSHPLASKRRRKS